MKMKLVKVMAVAAVAVFATSCGLVKNPMGPINSVVEVTKHHCGEWTFPKHLTDAGKAACKECAKKSKVDCKKKECPKHKCKTVCKGK